MSMLDEAIRKAADVLRGARHAVAFTGAGISTPSGIPDFRSKNTGLWETSNPMEVASIRVFQSHPERFYNWLRPLMRVSLGAGPNPAHNALAQLEEAGVIKAVITQNIDDLHTRAGSKNVYEVHGSVRTLTCPQCHKTHPAESFTQQILEDAEMPRCSHCGRVMKPDIVLFGEMLPVDVWQAAEEHCLQADAMLVIGSSLEVWPAAGLPQIAIEHGAPLIINNLSPTPLDRMAAVLLPHDVADVMPKIAGYLL